MDPVRLRSPTESKCVNTLEMDTAWAQQWPAELLPASDVRQCGLSQQYDALVQARDLTSHAHVMWAPKRANCGNDAGIIATAPSATPGGCWPSHVSRAADPTSDTTGFFVAACAPSNANELRRDRYHEHGVIGAACSRSHQMFMNTTRKCTGTYRPAARQSCRHHERQNLLSLRE